MCGPSLIAFTVEVYIPFHCEQQVQYNNYLLEWRTDFYDIKLWNFILAIFPLWVEIGKRIKQVSSKTNYDIKSIVNNVILSAILNIVILKNYHNRWIMPDKMSNKNTMYLQTL